MVSQRRRRRVHVLLEHFGHSLMPTAAPRRRQVVVEGGPDQRVDEAPLPVGLFDHQPVGCGLLQRRQAVALDLGDGVDDVQCELLTHHRTGEERVPNLWPEQCDPLMDHASDACRHRQAVEVAWQRQAPQRAHRSGRFEMAE